MLGANGNTSATESVGSPGLPGLAGENGDVGAMGSAGPAALSWTGATRALGTCDAPGKRVSFSIKDCMHLNFFVCRSAALFYVSCF